MLTVALTGSVASGKSSVARVWRDAGVPVVEADRLAREAVEPGSEGLREVVDAFGEEVLGPDGALDRERMRAIVFDDPDARRRLEAIVHPRVRARREAWLSAVREAASPVAVAEIPLLFETGMEDEFDVVVVVDASVEERIRRMRADRGIDEAGARRIMEAQMPAEEKRRRADIVIENDGTPGELEARARGVLRRILDRAPATAPAVREWMRIDLHLHTRGSRDSLSDPEAVLARATAVGIDRIAITDHDVVEVALEMADRHPDRVIAGEEVRTREGVDVIGLYLRERIPRGTPAEETCRRIRAQGGLVYLPHPFAGGKGGGGRMVDELAPHLDVIEVFNARLHPARLNDRARDWARGRPLLRGAGSDAHTVREVGRGAVEVPRHENRAEALRAALRTAAIRGRSSPWRVHLASTWAKVRKRLPGA